MDKQIVLNNCKQFLAKKGSFSYRICKLLNDDEFSDVLSSQVLTHLLNEGAGKKIKVSDLSASMQSLLKEDIIKVKILGRGKNKRKFWFPSWMDKKQIECKLNGGIVLTEEILSKNLIVALGKDFETEIFDLNLNYGKSGTCTAFLLRKILEKLIFLTFVKNGSSEKIKEKNLEKETG